MESRSALGQFYTRGAGLAKARLAAAERFYHEDALRTIRKQIEFQ